MGLTILTGGVEAIIDGLVAVVFYAAWQLVSQGRRGVGPRPIAVSAAWMAGGLVAGLAVGTAQWLPGLLFTSQSQRAAPSYQFFTIGSLDYHLLALLVSPFILGTNQTNPTLYVGQYNLPEVTSYMGVLALIAATSLWARRFRRRPEARAWRGLVRAGCPRDGLRPGRVHPLRARPLSRAHRAERAAAQPQPPARGLRPRRAARVVDARAPATGHRRPWETEGPAARPTASGDRVATGGGGAGPSDGHRAAGPRSC